MNLTRRQKNIVEQIIRSEADGAVLGYREGQKLLDRSLLNEQFEINEAGPDHLRVDHEVMKQALDRKVDEFDDIAFELAQNVLDKFDQRLFKMLADVANEHGMFSGQKTSGPMLKTDVEDAMTDDVTLNQQQCVSDIVEALSNYLKSCSQMVVSLVSDSDADDWNDNPSSLNHVPEE